MADIGRILIMAGLFLAGFGILIVLASKVPGVGKLPGDIFIQKGNFSFYFPLATCIILSIILSIILNLWPRK